MSAQWTHHLPLDVLGCAVLALLDARDLMRLRASDPSWFDASVSGGRGVYAARRVLLAAELEWFERCCGGMQVQLFKEREVRDPGTCVQRECWLQNGQLHRDGDQPAVVWTNGSRAWYQNNLRHRDGDLPAAIWAYGMQEWLQNGRLHRGGDLPAVILVDGSQKWCRGGKLHRDGDRPAIIWADGSRYWYRDGKLHRDGDQPAIVQADGARYWYLGGKMCRGGDLLVRDI